MTLGVKISRRKYLQNLIEELSSLEVAAIKNIPKEITKPDIRQKVFCQIITNCKRTRLVGYCSRCEKSVCEKLHIRSFTNM